MLVTVRRGDETREREWEEREARLRELDLQAQEVGWMAVAEELLAELAAARQETGQLREVYEAGQAVMDHWQLRIGGTRPLTAPEERFAAALAAVTGNEPGEAICRCGHTKRNHEIGGMKPLGECHYGGILCDCKAFFPASGLAGDDTT